MRNIIGEGAMFSLLTILPCALHCRRGGRIVLTCSARCNKSAQSCWQLISDCILDGYLLKPIHRMDRVGGKSLRVLSKSHLSGPKHANFPSRGRSLTRTVTGEKRSLTAQPSSLESGKKPESRGQKRILKRKKSATSSSAKSRRTLQQRTVEAIKENGIVPGKLARNNKLTKLEQKSITTDSLCQYYQYFCKENDGSGNMDSSEVDKWLADFMDVMFLEGRGAHEGEKTLAAVEFDNIDHKGKLSRSRRALRGWRKVMPATSRLPLPRLLAMGMAMKLYAMGLPSMALMALVAFHMYLRPGEAIDLCKRHVIAPIIMAGNQFAWINVVIRDIEGLRPDKVGVFDNSLPFDKPNMQWVGEFLLARASKLPTKDSRIFDFSMEDFRKKFQQVGAELGVLNLHPYQLRHGGATEDLTSGARDFNMVKMRGRWRADQSVRRYAKVGRVQQHLAKLPSSSKSFCRWSELNLQKVFRGVTPARAF